MEFAVILPAIVISAAALAAAPLQRAAEVHDSVGVNVHLEYTDGGYRDLKAVQACLNYLGLQRLRDAAPSPRNQGQAAYAALAQAGFKFDLFVNGEPIAPALERLAALRRRYPSSIESLEGPNEINNHAHFSYEGETDRHRAATAYQAALFAQIKADATLANVPLASFTDYPATFGRADLANLHDYPPADEPPEVGIDRGLAEVAITAPNLPFVVTELGFSTSNKAPDVSELAQARLLLSSLLEDARVGVRRTYVYELLDAYPDPGGQDHEKHYGLFDLQYRPKLAARALRRFVAAYQDDGPAQGSAAAGGDPIRPRSAASDLRSLVVRTRAGATIVALWRAVRVYDTAARADVEVKPEAVDLDLPVTRSAVHILDPVAGLQGEVRREASATRVMVGANPLLITLTPEPTGAPAR